MNIWKQGRSMLVVSGVILAAFAQASLVDATILIDRAANNKTLTVRYDGAKAALVEMRINGRSVASRAVNADSNNGETNFSVDIASLEEGDNEVEIRLYDKDGKEVGRQISAISIDRSGTGPVFLTSPKRNETVQGMAEIKVGFQSSLKNVYVSFFVNDEFKILRNYPPYNFVWDTTSVPNGWHEVQAWVVDESNATFKTEKLRLFVNNPGGLTKREEIGGNTLNNREPVVVPKTTDATKLSAPDQAKVGGIADVRPVSAPGNLASGPRVMNTQPVNDPKASTGNGQAVRPGEINVPTVKIETTPPVEEKIDPKTDLVVTTPLVAPKLKPVSVTFGSRVEYNGTYDVYLDGQLVTFDVSPRIVDGVPVSPFRHLLEGYGGEVKWDHDTKTVEGDGENLRIRFRIGDPTAYVDGQTIVMELAPYIQSGRSMVPLSFLSQALKVDVQFDMNTGHVIILSNKNR